MTIKALTTYSKKVFIIAFIAMAFCKGLLSQSITLYSNPDSVENYGYSGVMQEFNDSIYFRFYPTYNGNIGKIAKFNGSSYRLLDLVEDIGECSVVYNNNLYYLLNSNCCGGYGKLMRVNNDGSSTLINNPDASFGFSGQPIVFNGKLYCRYINATGNSSIGVFDGTSTSLIPQPPGLLHPGFTSTPLIHNGYLYWIFQTNANKYLLGKYDGITLTLIGNPGAGAGIKSEMVVLNNDLYFNFNDSLGRFDGTSITTIPLPITAAKMWGDPVAYAGKIWFKTYRPTDQYQLAYYNGTSINFFGATYPYNIGFYSTLVYQDKLYFGMDSLNNLARLARLDANGIKTFPNLNPYDPGCGGDLNIYNNNLYFTYFTEDQKAHLGKFNGTSIYAFPHPPTGNGGMYNFSQPRVIYKGSMYFGYSCPIDNDTHLKFARLKDSVLTLSVCSNSGLPLLSDLTGSTYQWQADIGTGFVNINNNTNYSGTNTQSLMITNMASSWSGYRFRCVVDGSFSQSFILQFTNTWTGAISNAWENPGNWSCGNVPGPTTNVYIQSGNVVISSNVTINSLHVVAPATVTVTPGYNLLVLN